MKYYITVGLPASGKSTWAKEYKEKNDKHNFLRYIEKVKIINCDNKTDVEECIKKNLYKRSLDTDRIIIDGLFTTNMDVKKVINCLKLYEGDEIIICQWEENREQCLRNDLYRREKNSSVTIRNLPYEEIDIENLGFENVSKINFKVYEKEEYEVFISKVNEERRYLKSDSWSLGGTGRNCWGDEWEIEKDDEEVEFKEFDILLVGLCPNITFLQYKKIYEKCVVKVEDDVCDYYGGIEGIGYWECDLKKLYEMLREMELIESV